MTLLHVKAPDQHEWKKCYGEIDDASERFDSNPSVQLKWESASRYICYRVTECVPYYVQWHVRHSMGPPDDGVCQ